MVVRSVVAAAFLAMVLLPAVASAQHGVSDQVRFEEDLDRNEFMVTARARAVMVPDFLLGIWFDEHGSHWSDGHYNMSYGGEFVWRRGTDFELGLGIDHADLTMADAFWLEAGDDAQGADWTEVDMRILSFVFSAYWFWDVEPWFTPYFGGGVGLGMVLGDVVRYEPRDGTACRSNLGDDVRFAPAECFTADGEPDENQFEDPEPEEEIWPAYPMIHLSGGMRFNIHDHGVVKLEAGVYPYLFAGLQLGGQF